VADAKISELTSYNPPVSTDVFPVLDIATTTTKKITLANISAYLASLAQTLTNKTLTSPVLNDPVINGTPSGTGVSVDNSAITLALRNDDQNILSNNFIKAYATTATAAGTTTLQSFSEGIQYFTGTSTQTVLLPDATSGLTTGFQIMIVNSSTGAVTVQTSTGTAVLVLAGGTAALFTCLLTSGNTAASWGFVYYATVVTSGKKLSASNSLTLVGTDGITITFPSTSATMARTDAANTFTGIQTITNLTLPTNGQILLTVPTSDGHATGPTTNAFNSGYSSSAVGDLVYLDSSSTWQKCDANTLALYNGLLGIALEVKASGNALLVALPGSFVYATGFPTFTVGSPIYMSETAGAVTHTQPTTTDAAIRVIGWGIHADKMFFYPSSDYITHT